MFYVRESDGMEFNVYEKEALFDSFIDNTCHFLLQYGFVRAA